MTMTWDTFYSEPFSDKPSSATTCSLLDAFSETTGALVDGMLCCGGGVCGSQNYDDNEINVDELDESDLFEPVEDDDNSIINNSSSESNSSDKRTFSMDTHRPIDNDFTTRSSFSTSPREGSSFLGYYYYHQPKEFNEFRPTHQLGTRRTRNVDSARRTEEPLHFASNAKTKHNPSSFYNTTRDISPSVAKKWLSSSSTTASSCSYSPPRPQQVKVSTPRSPESTCTASTWTMNSDSLYGDSSFDSSDDSSVSTESTDPTSHLSNPYLHQPKIGLPSQPTTKSLVVHNSRMRTVFFGKSDRNNDMNMEKSYKTTQRKSRRNGNDRKNDAYRYLIRMKPEQFPTTHSTARTVDIQQKNMHTNVSKTTEIQHAGISMNESDDNSYRYLMWVKPKATPEACVHQRRKTMT